MSDTDLWDDAGPFHYRLLPETSIDAFFTDERDMLTITHDLGKWWIGESRVQGQSPYVTLAEAKAAGDEQIVELEKGLDALLLAEAGLDSEEWSIDYSEGLSFVRRDGRGGVYANIHRPKQNWDAYSIGPDPIATALPDVASALAAIAQEQHETA